MTKTLEETFSVKPQRAGDAPADADTEAKAVRRQALEAEVKTLLTPAAQAWDEAARLLNLIKADGLWSSSGAPSWTAYVKGLSKDLEVHESSMWRMLDAYSVMQSYNARHPTERIASNTKGISQEALVNIGKIARSGRDPNKQAAAEDYWVGQALAGMPRDQILKAWQKVRDANKAAVQPAAGSVAPPPPPAPTTTNKDGSIAASMLVTALIKADGYAIPGAHEEYQRRKVFNSKVNTPVYRVRTEFPIWTGTTESGRPRAIDAVVAENISTPSLHEIYLHAIEIKVTEYDFERDKKFMEYGDYADFGWIYVPFYLEDKAVELTPKAWGILVYDFDQARPEVLGKIRVNRPAEQNENPAEILTAYQTALLVFMGQQNA